MTTHDELIRAMGALGVLCCTWLGLRCSERARRLLGILVLVFLGLILFPQVLRHGGPR